MSKLSDKKKEKISEHIISILYENYPKMLFTSEVASEVVRDEELTKNLLKNLLNKGIVVSIHKNPKGVKYSRRIRWIISKKTYDFYSKNYNTTKLK